MNFDLRLTKRIHTRFGEAQFFLDIDNLFNRRHLYAGEQFLGPAFSVIDRDFDRYMWSLHLPEDIFDQLRGVDADAAYRDKEGLPYLWVPGDDKPGDFRKPGIAFQPIEAVASLPDAPADGTERGWQWARDTGEYARWTGSAWEPVPDGELRQVLDDKAYIDMPNLRFQTFLNPRRFVFGVRLRF